MSTNASCAIIRGIPNYPTVNVRAGPGTGHELRFTLPVETRATILDALPDEAGNGYLGKRFQWLLLRTAEGGEGWVRDDLLDLAPGDHTGVGYGVLGARTYAFTLQRDEAQRPPQTVTVEAQPMAESQPTAEEAPPLWIPADAPQPPEAPTPASGETPPLWIPAEETAPVVETPPVIEEVPPVVSSPLESSASIAFVIGARGAINARSGPSTAYPVLLQVERGTRLEVLADRPEEGGTLFRWVKVSVQAQECWIREDMLSFQGAGCVTRGLLPAADLYPAPLALPNYWWVRGFTGPQPDHPGWDLGAAQGEPVLAGPQGGTVVIAFTATNATPERPSVRDHGIRIGDPAIFSNPGWGFGYGHYVVVRYLNEQLPRYTRDALASRGLPGAAIYAMYAHLHTRAVMQGQVVGAGEAIGTCGTTGNSEAPHVHLEIRASANAAETSWAWLGRGLLDPGILFSR